MITQLTFTCSKSIIEKLEKGVKCCEIFSKLTIKTPERHPLMLLTLNISHTFF